MNKLTVEVGMFNCGLGNRLFQIAAGRYLARRTNRMLVLDPVQLLIMTGHENDKETKAEYLWLTKDIQKSKEGKIQWVTITESPFALESPDSLISRINSFPTQNVKLRGYFQLEQYLDSNFRSWINISNKPEARLTITENILNESFAVHVRLGDFLLSSGLNILCENGKLHDYFKQAMDIFPSHLKCVVFTEDVEFCKKDPIFSNSTRECIFAPVDTTWNTLYTMSRCKYGCVTSNSSFSWWGGVLNDNAQHKRVIMPRRKGNTHLLLKQAIMIDV